MCLNCHSVLWLKHWVGYCNWYIDIFFSKVCSPFSCLFLRVWCWSHPPLLFNKYFSATLLSIFKWIDLIISWYMKVLSVLLLIVPKHSSITSAAVLTTPSPPWKYLDRMSPSHCQTHPDVWNAEFSAEEDTTHYRGEGFLTTIWVSRMYVHSELLDFDKTVWNHWDHWDLLLLKKLKLQSAVLESVLEL